MNDENIDDFDADELSSAKNKTNIYIAISVACIVTVCVLLANKIDPGELEVPNFTKSPIERAADASGEIVNKGFDAANDVLDKVIKATDRSKDDGRPAASNP